MKTCKRCGKTFSRPGPCIHTCVARPGWDDAKSRSSTECVSESVLGTPVSLRSDSRRIDISCQAPDGVDCLTEERVYGGG